MFVFALTQISHLVIRGELSLASVGQAAFLLLVVWWAWIYTVWMVNWFDPASAKVRLILGCVTLASLLMAAAIPTAYTGGAGLFVGAYVVLQVGRNGTALLLIESDHHLRRVFERLVAWSCLSGVFWVVGAFTSGPARSWIWGVALAIDLAAPLAGYRTPGLGRSLTTDWDVEGGHFAERFQSFVIIALGEAIVVTGATASARGLDVESVIALTLAFLISGTLFWLYFGVVAENSLRDMVDAEDPGSLARDAYTYLHLPIVAGIIMVAIADDLLLAHPGDPLTTAGIVMAVAGPAIYLLGESAVRLRMIGRVSPKRIVCVLALAIVGCLGGLMSATVLSACVAGVLVALAFWESGSWPRPRASSPSLRARRASSLG